MGVESEWWWGVNVESTLERRFNRLRLSDADVYDCRHKMWYLCVTAKTWRPLMRPLMYIVCVSMHACVCVNVDEDAGRGCMQECEGGNRVRPCIMNQRSNCVWRGWACLWDVPSWASEAVEEAAAAELVCCRPTIGQKCYSWEGLCKLGRSISRCSVVGLENHRLCWLAQTHHKGWQEWAGAKDVHPCGFLGPGLKSLAIDWPIT